MISKRTHRVHARRRSTIFAATHQGRPLNGSPSAASDHSLGRLGLASGQPAVIDDLEG